MGLGTSYLFHQIEKKFDGCCCVPGTRDTVWQGRKALGMF